MIDEDSNVVPTESKRIGEVERKLLANIQVDNLCKLLDGESSIVTIVNSRGDVSKRIVIEYKDD